MKPKNPQFQQAGPNNIQFTILDLWLQNFSATHCWTTWYHLM